MTRRMLLKELSASLKILWNEWQLRTLVLLSLALQILLTLLANRRKHIKKIWITILVWPAYLMADLVATSALGVLANHLFCHTGILDANLELTAFWAPFLLLHLGGPDTITAYSLEDNELWTRHLLQLVVQAGFAFYILQMAWTGSYLSFLTIPMMLAGLIKYGERAWVLWSASFEQRRESTQNFHKMLQVLSGVGDHSNIISDDKLLQVADGLFEMAKPLFADVPITIGEQPILENQQGATLQLLDKLSARDAFKVIEMQLGFVYDMLYTKATVAHTSCGIGLRFISFLLTSIVLLLFSLLYHAQEYSKVDLTITFLLLAAAIVLELYATLLLLLSDQTVARLRNYNRTNISRVITTSLPLLKNPRWSNSIGQYNLLSYFLKEKPMGFYSILKVKRINEKLEKQQYAAYSHVPGDMKEWLIMYIKLFMHLGNFESATVSIFAVGFARGMYTMGLMGYNEDVIRYTASLIEFQQQILVWCIATELCHRLDHDFFVEGIINQNVVLNRRMSKLISRYMMYLVAISPGILAPASGTIGQVNFRLTCDEARKEIEEFFKAEDPAVNIQGTRKERRRNIKIQASKWLFERHRNSITDVVQMFGQADGSLLTYACSVLDSLLKHGPNDAEEQRMKMKWKLIAGVWVELLLSAAINCKVSQHAQQLKEGGEFLTHVWLLLAESVHLKSVPNRGTN